MAIGIVRISTYSFLLREKINFTLEVIDESWLMRLKLPIKQYQNSIK
jgi:hypothetical protein